MRTSVTDLGTFCTFQIAAAEERNFIDCITLPSLPPSIPIPPFLCPSSSSSSSSSSSLLQLDAVIALQRAGESHASRDVVQRARPLSVSLVGTIVNW